MEVFTNLYQSQTSESTEQKYFTNNLEYFVIIA